MKSTNFSKWLYLLAGTVIGILICWTVMKVIESLATARQIQKEIEQSLATGKFNNFQKHISNLQKSFPIAGDFSEEKISKMMEELGVNKQGKSFVREKKKAEV